MKPTRLVLGFISCGVQVPFCVRRFRSTWGTLSGFPLMLACRAKSTTFECIPTMPALAGPETLCARHPFAWGALDAG